MGVLNHSLYDCLLEAAQKMWEVKRMMMLTLLLVLLVMRRTVMNVKEKRGKVNF